MSSAPLVPDVRVRLPALIPGTVLGLDTLCVLVGILLSLTHATDTLLRPNTATMDQEFGSALQDMKNVKNFLQLQAFMKDFVPSFAEVLKRHSETLVEKLQAELKAKDEKITSLERSVSTLKTQVQKMEEQLDDQEAYERKNTVIISGAAVPAVSANENVTQLVCSMARETLRLNLTQADISVAHRLGSKPQNQGQDRRRIVVKLCRQETKNALLANARKVKHPDMYVSESLTPQRQNIAYALRKAKKDHPNIVSGTSTSNGRVYVYVKAQGQASGMRDTRIEINTLDRLANFCQRTLSVGVDHYLPNTYA